MEMYFAYSRKMHCACCGDEIGQSEDYYYVDGLAYCESCMAGMKIEGYLPDEWDFSGEDEHLEAV